MRDKYKGALTSTTIKEERTHKDMEITYDSPS